MSRSRSVISVACAIVLAGCAGSAGGGAIRDSQVGGTATPVPEPAVATAAAERRAIAVGPVGAALRFVASTDTLLAHSSIGRERILTRLVTAEAVGPQAAALEDAATRIAATLDVPVERLVWVEAPLASTIVTSAPTTASVDVWTISVLGVPGKGSPQQVWRTVHIELVLQATQWLVSAATADAGPTPAANELAMQAGWHDFEVVAAWTPVIEGEDL